MKNTEGIRRDCLPRAVLRAIARDTGALRAGAAIFVKKFHGWMGGKNGPICRGKEADDILSLKENQSGLYRDGKLYFEEY